MNDVQWSSVFCEPSSCYSSSAMNSQIFLCLSSVFVKVKCRRHLFNNFGTFGSLDIMFILTSCLCPCVSGLVPVLETATLTGTILPGTAHHELGVRGRGRGRGGGEGEGEEAIQDLPHAAGLFVGEMEPGKCALYTRGWQKQGHVHRYVEGY